MVGITCIGTKARKDVKFNVKTMVFYPLLFGGTCILLCLLCHKGTWGGMLMGIPTNRCLYVLTSVLGIMAAPPKGMSGDSGQSNPFMPKRPNRSKNKGGPPPR